MAREVRIFFVKAWILKIFTRRAAVPPVNTRRHCRAGGSTRWGPNIIEARAFLDGDRRSHFQVQKQKKREEVRGSIHSRTRRWLHNHHAQGPFAARTLSGRSILVFVEL